MEQQAGIAGWEYMARAPKPGQMAAWAMQSVAHGADSILFFDGALVRWERSSFGMEY